MSSSKEGSTTTSQPDFVDGVEPSSSDSLTCPSQQEDMLMKGLKVCFMLAFFIAAVIYTVDSRYLEVEGTL